MTIEYIVETELVGAERLMNSRNGNPRFRLMTRDGAFLTETDAAISYEISNYINPIPEGGSVPVRLVCNRGGRVWDIRSADDD